MVSVPPADRVSPVGRVVAAPRGDLSGRPAYAPTPAPLVGRRVLPGAPRAFARRIVRPPLGVPPLGAGVKRLAAPHPRRFTGRATVLFAVLIALALAYTYPVRVYLDQQADIERMEAAQAVQAAEIAKLEAEAANWNDPAYIKTQARERFFMGEPGEKMMVVLHDPEGAARDAGKSAGSAAPAGPSTWYDTLWSSVQAADSQQPGK